MSQPTSSSGSSSRAVHSVTIAPKNDHGPDKETIERCHICHQILTFFYAVVNNGQDKMKMCSNTCLQRHVTSNNETLTSKKVAEKRPEPPNIHIDVDLANRNVGVIRHTRSQTTFT